MRIYRALMGIAMIGGASFSGAVAAGGATKPPPFGVIHIYEVSKATGTSVSVVLTGLVNDAGVDQGGKLTLSKGTFQLTPSAKLKKQLQSLNATPLNATSCAASGSVTGAASISHGTNSYKKISGTVTITHTLAAIGSLKNGKCVTGTSSKPVGAINIVTGAGLVKLQ